MDCAYCRGTGWIEVPEDDGESAYETACPECDPEPGAPLVKRNTTSPGLAVPELLAKVPRCETCGRYPIDHRGGVCIYPPQWEVDIPRLGRWDDE